MPDLNIVKPKGVLRQGWSATIGDYAIAGGWTLRGKALVVGDTAGGVYAFRGKSGVAIWEQREVHEGGVLAIAIHPSGTEFATAGQDGRVLIWSAKEGKVTQTIEIGSNWVEHVAWSLDGKWLAASSARQVYVYNRYGVKIWTSDAHPSTISALAWSSIGDLATACYGRVTFFEASTGELRQKMEWKGSLVSLVLSPDGNVVACGSQDNSVHFWYRSTEEDSMMSGYPSKPSALAFDDTSTLLATGGGESVTVWSFQGSGPEGTRPGVLELHVQPVTTLAFAFRGMRLASGARDGSVAVWSLQSDGKGEPVGAAIVEDVVAELYWRPDGRALAALNAQGGVVVWRVSN